MTDLTQWRGSLQPASEREALEAKLTFCRRAVVARIEDLDDAKIWTTRWQQRNRYRRRT